MWGTRIKALPFKLVVQSEIEIWRAADFWTKEPETIAWIDSFTPGSVFWDIGANVGVFSIYASCKPIKEVYAFEPCVENHAKMVENFKINSNNISGYILAPYAMSDLDGKTIFYVKYHGAGYSGGQVGDSIDEEGHKFNPVESYYVQVYKIDTLADIHVIPNYIKIDVDGHEWKILQGASGTLGLPEVKGVLVEVNNSYADIDGYMKSFGFTDFNRFNASDLNRRANKPQRNVIYTRG